MSEIKWLLSRGEQEELLSKPLGTNFDARARHIEWLRNRVEDLENESPEQAEERRMEAAEYTRERLRLDCMEFVNGEEDE